MLNQLLKPVLEALPENNRLERIWILAKFDFKKRYYDNGLGILWALLNPLFQLVIYYLVFTYILGNKVPNFALYLFSGLLIWMFFSQGTRKGITVLKTKRYLIENINFKKLDLFYAATFSALFGFLFNFMAYLIISLVMGIPFSFSLIYVPVLITNLFLLILAISILLGTINIYLKDINHVWDIVILAGFWSTPIIYDQQLVIDKFPLLLYLNPVAGIMVNTRNTALYGREPDYYLMIYGIVFTLVFLGLSIILFKKFSAKAAEKL